MVVRPSASGKVWSNLSPNYRARLERNGVTRSQYERGESLKAARGHGNTPESPAEALRNPDKYERYLSERNNLVDRITELKQQRYAGSVQFNADRAKLTVQYQVEIYYQNGQRKERITHKLRSISQLKQILSLLEGDDIDFESGEMSDDIQSAFYYH